MKSQLLVCSSILAIVLTGCRSFTSPARAHKFSDGSVWVDYDATRRGGLILGEDAHVRMLAEPAPDVAMGVVAEFVAKGSYQGITGETSAKVTETISELGKRTQTVMVLRECLYRLNEMQLITKDLTKEEVKDLYQRILETILELARTDTAKAKADALTEANSIIEKLGKDQGKTLLDKLKLDDQTHPSK